MRIRQRSVLQPRNPASSLGQLCHTDSLVTKISARRASGADCCLLIRRYRASASKCSNLHETNTRVTRCVFESLSTCKGFVSQLTDAWYDIRRQFHRDVGKRGHHHWIMICRPTVPNFPKTRWRLQISAFWEDRPNSRNLHRVRRRRGQYRRA